MKTIMKAQLVAGVSNLLTGCAMLATHSEQVNMAILEVASGAIMTVNALDVLLEERKSRSANTHEGKEEGNA